MISTSILAYQEPRYRERDRSWSISLNVINGRGTDGDDGWGAGRGVIRSVRTVVIDSDDGGNTGGDEVGGDSVDGSGETTAKAQGSNRRATAVFSNFSNPVNSGNAVWDVDVQKTILL